MRQDQLTPIEGIRRHLKRSIRSYLVGDEQPARGFVPSDEGWFGPDSITRRVQGDWSTLIGGVQSLLVQTLHPPTMAGVADHSDYRHDATGRLRRTAEFIGTTVWGSAEQAQQSVDLVRSIHSRVTGTTPGGVPYEANDPHNLMWVHLTEVDAFLRAYQRFGIDTLTRAEADRYVAEMARVGEALGVQSAPRCVDEVKAALESYLPELEFGAQARDCVRWIVLSPYAKRAPIPYAVILSAAASQLPPWARRKMWLPPALRPVDDVVLVPSVKAMVRAVDWIMDPSQNGSASAAAA